MAMAVLTVSIIPSNVEPFCWLGIFLVVSFAIAKYAPGRYFLHGFMVSIFNSIWITAAHAAFFDQYIAAHPEYLQATNGLPPDLAGHPRRMMVPIGAISGIIFGVVLGVFAFIASRMFRRAPTEQ